MRTLLGSVQFWTYVLLMLCLSPAAMSLGSLWQWMPGTASAVLLTLPVCASALTGSRALAVTTAVLAVASVTAEVLSGSTVAMGASGIWLPLTSAAGLLCAGVLISTGVNALQRRVEHLEQQNTQQLHDLFRRERDEAAANRPQAESSVAEQEAAIPPARADDNSVDYAMLLLTLQDIGRRIGMEIDLETLIPTIISTARSSLRCGNCQVYFWNARERTFRNALPPRSRDLHDYVPRPDAGMAAWVLKHRQILTRKDLESDYTLQQVREQETVLPDAIAPLWVGTETLGLMVIDRVEEDSPTFMRVLYIVATHYALGIKNAQLFKRIEDMARRDSLTGLLNHASFHEELQKLVQTAKASSAPLSVIMCDLDHFKRANDTYGHPAGDHVLRTVSRLLQAALPASATIARYGGEEFICALPGETQETARELAELLRKTLDSQPIDFEGQTLHVTGSLGVAEFSPAAATPAAIVKLADEALYRAKASGRNRVVCSTPEVNLASAAATAALHQDQFDEPAGQSHHANPR